MTVTGHIKYFIVMDQPVKNASFDDILFEERKKDEILGFHKQSLTRQQIYMLLVNQGFDMSYTIIAIKINGRIRKAKKCFIKQSHDYGACLEYYFGEDKLLINGILGRYHMAVISFPAVSFRWPYLYKNQKKETFMDPHVRFFEMVGGVYKEVVYNNMRNVGSKFIIYYAFNFNVTNCFNGNEKGHVEDSVKIIRNFALASKYEFVSIGQAQIYLNSQLFRLNEDSRMDEESFSFSHTNLSWNLQILALTISISIVLYK